MLFVFVFRWVGPHTLTRNSTFGEGLYLVPIHFAAIVTMSAAMDAKKQNINVQREGKMYILHLYVFPVYLDFVRSRASSLQLEALQKKGCLEWWGCSLAPLKPTDVPCNSTDGMEGCGDNGVFCIFTHEMLRTCSYTHGPWN